MNKSKHRILISICSLDEFKQLSRARLKQAAAGRAAEEPTHRLYFTDEENLFSTLTPKRMELLRHLKQHGPLSHRQLALQLNRAYANVHEDVKQLMQLDLIDKGTEQKLAVPWDELDICVPLAA